MLKNIPNEGIPGWEWPEFNSDRTRIRHYSDKCRNEQLSIAEMFNAVYNLNLNDQQLTNPHINDVPYELSVGDLITTKILSVGKNKVVFDAGNFKANLQSNINLHKYDRFKHFLPIEPINAVVVDVKKDRVTIDPIKPMVDEWMVPIIKDPTIQKKVLDIHDHDADKRFLTCNATPIKVKNLQLTRGGFMGKAVIPNVSDFVGEDYTVDAFIPGSQIVLNITDNFEQFVGATVDTFILNYMQKPGSKDMSLICSAKDYLKFLGDMNIINMFKVWCESNDNPEPWKVIAEKNWEGRVTGIINSSKKCGVFVEIPELNITGMVPTKPEELVNYKPHTDITVKISGFEEEMYFNQAAGQMQHNVPYTIENGVLKNCSIKPILTF